MDELEREAAWWGASFCDRMFDDWSLEYESTTVGRGRTSYCVIRRPYHIVLGMKGLKYWYANGYKDYRSIEYLWEPQERMRGDKAVWALCIHEFAHALQGEIRGASRGSVHNASFVRAVRTLQRLYPWEGLREEVEECRMRKRMLLSIIGG
jgi:hypothetical protein